MSGASEGERGAAANAMSSPPTIRDQEAFYDDRWRSFAFAGSLNLEKCAAILKALSDTGIHTPRVVELGCGAGWLTAILGAFGPAEGVELSPLAVEQASKRYGHVRFRQVDLGRWDAAARPVRRRGEP